MAWMQLAGETDLLANQVSTLCECVGLCSASQYERVLQPRNA